MTPEYIGSYAGENRELIKKTAPGKEKINHKPAWVTRQNGGYGFAEMVDLILAK